jgi:phenylacetate-CoA ligase
VAGACDCGRNSLRIGPILGRKSHMIKVKGTTMYPLAITNILDDIEGIEDYLIILEDDESLSDRVSLHAVTPPANLEKIANRIRTELRVHIPVLISNIATIQHYRGKSHKKPRILDNRKHARRTA